MIPLFLLALAPAPLLQAQDPPSAAVLDALEQPSPDPVALFTLAWLEDRSVAPLLAELEAREAAALESGEDARRRDLMLLRARLLHRRGDLRPALQVLDDLVEEEETPELLWEQARLFDGLGRTAEALAGYQAALPAFEGTPREIELLVRMALLSMQTDDEQEDALAAFARAEGRSDAMRNRAAIVLALQERYEEAIELAVVSGEGQVRFRQEVRIAEWALHAEDAEAAQEHAWQARAAATLNRDRWYALTVLVEAHRMDDSLDRLIDRFAAAEALDEPARQVWIDLLRETERFDEARALFAAGAAEEGFPVEMQRELLEMDREAGRADEMVAAYESLLVDEPERVAWPEGLARYRLEQGDEEGARAAWTRFLATHEAGGRLLAGAEALMGLGLDDLAIEAAERCIADGRGRMQAYLFLFDLHRTRGRLDLAEEALVRMDEAAPADAPERMQLAESLERIGQLERSVDVLMGIREAREQVAEDLEMRLAWLLSETGQEEEAMAQWQALWRKVDSIPRRRYVEDRMMTVASRLGVLADIAIELEKRLVAGEADDRDAGLLVRLYTKVGDPVSATEVIEEFLKHSGGSEVAALQEKARVYLACTDYRGYERTVRELIAVDPEGEPDYLRQLAMSMLERGRPEQARGVLARLDELEDRTDGAEFEAGVLALAGMREEAADAYRRGVAAKPDRIESYLLLADMMEQTGQKARAVGMFQWLAETADKDDLFTIAIDGLLNMEADQAVLQWAQRITLERLAVRHDKTYLYQLLADLAEEAGDKERQVAAIEGMLPIAGDRRASTVRELMDLAATGNRRVFGQDQAGSEDFLAYGRRLIGLGQLVPPQVYLDLGRAFLRSKDIDNAVRTFGLARDLPDLAQFQRDTAALYEENEYLEEALVTYRKALISDAGSIFLLVKVAELLEQTGKDEESFTLYRRATELLLARRPLRSGRKEQEESSDPFARYFARNVDEFDRYFERASKGLMVTADEARATALLDEQVAAMRAELAEVDPSEPVLVAYPRLRDRAAFLRGAAVAFGRAELAEEMDRALLAALPGDAELIEELVRTRVRWGLFPSARALLRSPGVSEDDARALGFLVGEAVQPSATALIPPAEAVGLILPLAIGDRVQDLRELLRRIDYADRSEEAQAAAGTILAAAALTEDQDLLLFVARHRLRQMLTRDNPASSYEMAPLFDRFAKALDADRLRSLNQYFVSLVLEDPERHGQALALLPQLQEQVEEPLLDAEQIKTLLEEQGRRLMYTLGPVLSLAPAEEQADLAAKVWDDVPPTARYYFVTNLVESFEGDMPPGLADLLVDWFAVALEENDDNFMYQLSSMLEDRLLERRGELVRRMVDVLLEAKPEHPSVLITDAVLRKRAGDAEGALATALEVWSLPVIQERSENYAWMVQNQIEESFITDDPEPFLDRFVELEKERSPDRDRMQRHLYEVRQLDDPDRYERTLRLAVERHPDDWPFLSQLASELRGQRRFAEAEALFDAALEAEPEDLDLARLYWYSFSASTRPVARWEANRRYHELEAAEKGEEDEEETEEAEGPQPPSVVRLKELVDEEDETGATLMLRRLWRSWPRDDGMRYGSIIYFGSMGPAAGRVEFPWPQEQVEPTAEEKAEQKALAKDRARGGLHAYQEPEEAEEVTRVSAWEVLADRDWAQAEMARRQRAIGPEAVGRQPSLLAGMAKFLVQQAGSPTAAVEGLLAKAAAGAADATDYRLLLTLLEGHPETVTPDAQQVLGELERSVDPADAEQLLRLARVMAATGARERAVSLYRWCATQATARTYFSFDGSSSGSIDVGRLVREVREVLEGDPALVGIIESALRVAAPSQNPWERESYELLVIDTWSGLLEPDEAVEKCRAILESTFDREQPLRRRVARKAAEILAAAGEVEKAIAAFEAGWCRVGAEEFATDRYVWSGNFAPQYLGRNEYVHFAPADPAKLKDPAGWGLALAEALPRWDAEDRLREGIALNLGAVLAWRLHEWGETAAAGELVDALIALDEEPGSGRLMIIDAARRIGRTGLAAELQQNLLEAGKLNRARLAETLAAVVLKDGPAAALALGEAQLDWNRSEEMYRSLADLAAQAEPASARIAEYAAAADAAQSAAAAIEAWGEEQRRKREGEPGVQMIRIR
ncbi:MAG: tetratricopeptide repeat protein [Planctomycetota bacterium]|jgi:hypothetical protein